MSVCVGDCVCMGTWIGVSTVCIGEWMGEMSCVCVFDCVCGVRSYDGVLRLSNMLQSASFGGEAVCGCSLSEGGWMEIHGGLIFFFLWPPPTDCTLTGNASAPFSDRRVRFWSLPGMRTCGRQTSIEWRLWSSGKPAHNDDGLSRNPWLSTPEPFLKS